jgi:hypothetical protein
LGIAGDAYVVFERIAGSARFGAAAALAGLAVLLVLWFVWPFAARARRTAPHGVSEPAR